MRRIGLILGVVLFGWPASAQTSRFSFGAIGGARLSSGAPAETHDESPRYTVGAAFEVSFGEHFAAEVDALYKRFGYSSVDELDYIATVTCSGGSFGTSCGPPSVPVSVIVSTRTRANSVEFPVMGKYYFELRGRRDRFFVATGYSFQHSWMTTASEEVIPDSGVSVFGGNLPGPPTEVGAVFGAGVARKMGPLAVTPVFRYTRWGARFDGASRNQLEILLGLRF